MLIREDKYDDAIRHISEQHFPDEVVGNSMGITFNDEAEEKYLLKFIHCTHIVGD